MWHSPSFSSEPGTMTTTTNPSPPPPITPLPSIPSLLHGPTDPPLITLTLSSFLDAQCRRHGSRECLVTPWTGNRWTGNRWTYSHLRDQSLKLARYLQARGIQPGDRVAILAGNRVEYAAVLFACVRVGAVLVVSNVGYTEVEGREAVGFTETKVLFATPWVGKNDHRGLLESLMKPETALAELQQIILLDGEMGGMLDYRSAVAIGARLPDESLQQIQDSISPFDTCNLQFTSGSTGHPKAAMLTHHGLLNNARFIGDRMSLNEDDVLCCPPPMFHCFGLVLGLLAVMTHGAKIIYPSEVFDGPAVLSAITNEKCTAVHGVPAMFDTLFSLPRPANFDCTALRTGIIAGAPVPRHLMELLIHDFGMTQFTSSYGLTEASPTCFNAFVDDSIDTRLTTVGTLMPHAHAKIVDRNGSIVPIGTRGELCIAGYQLQQGYFRRPQQTAEAMTRDENGMLWLHTGDEAIFDENGYCSITGRFKDIIIRGGENVYPLEIEERLVAHAAIARAVVVGLSDERLGEVVAAFLMKSDDAVGRPAKEEIREWTRSTLGRHKVPAHVFWLGEDGVPEEVPVTGSGKVRKFEMRRWGEEILAKRRDDGGNDGKAKEKAKL